MKSNKISNNGHEYVNLGLPSGTLWATCNVGASSPEEAGAFFQWGDTQGYLPEQIGTEEGQNAFTLDSYKLWKGNNFTKYTNISENGAKLRLKMSDDAARANWGGLWHMPSEKQIKELLKYTDSEFVMLNGVNGRKFTSKKDATKSIFIPASGDIDNGKLVDVEYYGFIWSSTLNKKHLAFSTSLGVWAGSAYAGITPRFNGASVRGVIG